MASGSLANEWQDGRNHGFFFLPGAKFSEVDEHIVGFLSSSVCLFSRRRLNPFFLWGGPPEFLYFLPPPYPGGCPRPPLSRPVGAVAFSPEGRAVIGGCRVPARMASPPPPRGGLTRAMASNRSPKREMGDFPMQSNLPGGKHRALWGHDLQMARNVSKPGPSHPRKRALMYKSSFKNSDRHMV